MATLRDRVIKLANEKPELRKHLIPLLRMAMEFDTKEQLEKYLKEHPGADKSLHKVKSEGGDKGQGEGAAEKGEPKKPRGTDEHSDAVRWNLSNFRPVVSYHGDEVGANIEAYGLTGPGGKPLDMAKEFPHFAEYAGKGRPDVDRPETVEDMKAFHKKLVGEAKEIMKLYEDNKDQTGDRVPSEYKSNLEYMLEDYHKEISVAEETTKEYEKDYGPWDDRNKE